MIGVGQPQRQSKHLIVATQEFNTPIRTCFRWGGTGFHLLLRATVRHVLRWGAGPSCATVFAVKLISSNDCINDQFFWICESRNLRCNSVGTETGSREPNRS